MRFATRISMLCAGTLALSSCSGQQPDTAKAAGIPVDGHRRLRAGHVCMVDNSAKDSLLIPVSLQGQTYYGCCVPCIDALRSDTSFRYATDPLSGKTVSKSTAYMALKNGSESDVEYFESEKNYIDHLNKNR